MAQRPMPLWDRNRTSHYTLTVGILATALVTDRLAKIAAERWLSSQEPWRSVGDLVVLILARNDGAFLGMGGDWPPVFKGTILLAIPALLCAAGLWWCWFRETDKLRLGALVALVGGGLGNLLDRAFLNFQVVDFLNVGIGPLRSGIVNVADLFVTAGALLLFWSARKRP